MREIILVYFISCFHFHLQFAQSRRTLCIFTHSSFLMDPMEKSSEQVADFLSRPSKGLAEGFSFPEDLLPACTRIDSSIPLLTMVKEMVRCGGSFILLRKFWGCFRATLGPENFLFSLNWSRAESLVNSF